MELVVTRKGSALYCDNYYYWRCTDFSPRYSSTSVYLGYRCSRCTWKVSWWAWLLVCLGTFLILFGIFYALAYIIRRRQAKARQQLVYQQQAYGGGQDMNYYGQQPPPYGGQPPPYSGQEPAYGQPAYPQPSVGPGQPVYGQPVPPGTTQS
eukprot:jgi/Mesen1/2655/ME000167S01802